MLKYRMHEEKWRSDDIISDILIKSCTEDDPWIDRYSYFNDLTKNMIGSTEIVRYLIKQNQTTPFQCSEWESVGDRSRNWKIARVSSRIWFTMIHCRFGYPLKKILIATFAIRCPRKGHYDLERTKRLFLFLWFLEYRVSRRCKITLLRMIRTSSSATFLSETIMIFRIF